MQELKESKDMANLSRNAEVRANQAQKRSGQGERTKALL